MKTIHLTAAAILGIFLLSCKESKSIYTADTSEAWELTTMQSGSMAGASEQPLPYQEHYNFFDDKTFEKNREDKGITVSGSGTYNTSIAEEGLYYNLLYTTTSPLLIGSCTGNKTETLLLKPNGNMQNSWAMCDGPYKVYQKK